MIGAMAVSLGVIFFIIHFLIGYDIITNIVYMIGIVVANVPEGLTISMTVVLSLAAKRMSAASVLVKNM